MSFDSFDSNDPQTDQIIKKVLGKKLLSQYQVKKKKQQGSIHLVSKVNQSLQEQNKSLLNEIKKLEKRIKKLSVYQSKDKINQQKIKLQALKSRIDKIQTLNSKLSSRIISESRAIIKLKQGSSSFDSYSNSIKKTNQNNKIQPSPIRQFNVYTLTEDPSSNNLDNCVNNLKNSQQKKQVKSQSKVIMKDKAIQINLDYIQNKQQRQKLKAMRRHLQDTIKQNQAKINLYQSKLEKLVL